MENSTNSKFILFVLKIGLALGSAGLLGEATLYLAEKAIEAQAQGLVSLGGYNRRLQGRSHSLHLTNHCPRNKEHFHVQK